MVKVTSPFYSLKTNDSSPWQGICVISSLRFQCNRFFQGTVAHCSLGPLYGCFRADEKSCNFDGSLGLCLYLFLEEVAEDDGRSC